MKDFFIRKEKVRYTIDNKGRFVIENYNKSKPFSSFFPGIAGLWGIPMWVFYVNRGQCIASFGIESKDKAIMEFQPANKAYRLVSLQGFRTFIKVNKSEGSSYWEPFQNTLIGTDFKKKQTLSISAHDIILEEINYELGLSIKVNYFTLPQQPYSALVRRVIFENLTAEHCCIEVIDGLPLIVPYGVTDVLNKNISRTIEAWVDVCGVDKNTPYYRLKVEVCDRPEVTHIRQGNFFFSFHDKTDGSSNADNNAASSPSLLDVIVDSKCVFGELCDFTAPYRFLSDEFVLADKQHTENRTPSAMSYGKYNLNSAEKLEIVSLFGYAHSRQQVDKIVRQVVTPGFIADKAAENETIIAGIRDFALTRSASREFDLYSSYTFLDNVLRGGLPVSIKTSEGNVTFNVYSRKHGDLERDYNYFFLSPTFYSQGNGNYRDVNQNRRNDIWFNIDVGDSNIINFLNLIQADGYNPLVVKGTTFRPQDDVKVDEILTSYVGDQYIDIIKEYLKEGFLPGGLISFIEEKGIQIKLPIKDFLGKLLEVCYKQEIAEHGEGFWTDHWTYNMDIIESYLALYPDRLEDILLNNKSFTFYLNSHYVLPRHRRYVLTDRGVRQYHSVVDGAEEIDAAGKGNKLRIKNGTGAVYYTNLACKLLCLIANKIATLDPSGIGVEMEAEKPNWYDSLNGLPGLLGSSVSETYEIKRLTIFLLEAIKQLALDDAYKFTVFEELATFISGLSNLLSLETDPYQYWVKSNDIKEHYRQRVRVGISGEEKQMPASEIKNFLNLVVARVDEAINKAKDNNNGVCTYFYHEVTEYEFLDGRGNEGTSYLRPTKFKLHMLPPFLEGYVHALRVAKDKEEARQLYIKVRESGLFDHKLKMYKLNADISTETEEIGRTRIFPKGWLENESVWLHMEYKFLLELLRNDLFEEYYDNFRNTLIPFLNPEQYGRSIFENSSFLVSSVHNDSSLHGRGFVARLSGSTAEFLHMWLYINIGKRPFSLNANKELVLSFKPALPGWMFTTEPTRLEYVDIEGNRKEIELPENIYAFNLLGGVIVVYHNPKRTDTFGENAVQVEEITLAYHNRKRPVTISSHVLTSPYSNDVRDRKVERIDVFFK